LNLELKILKEPELPKFDGGAGAAKKSFLKPEPQHWFQV